MQITLAKTAGFCFGVERAVDTLTEAIANKKEGERIFTLGTLIHNGVFNAELAEKGALAAKLQISRILIPCF